MKSLRINAVIILLFAITIFSSGQVVQKVIKEEYSASKKTTLNIDSKFGQVEILNWDKPVVSIEVIMKAESDNKDFAVETLQKLNASVYEEEGDIFVKTIIEDKISSTQRKKVKFSVDYTIYVPDWINTDLINKYGSVFIEKIDGYAHITVQYGNLTIRELGRENVKPLNQVVLAYSKGTIEKASWLKTDLSYSKLSIDDVQAIISISKYSSLSSEKISSLVIDSKYDTYSINYLRNLTGEMRYSNLKLNELSGKLDITSYYTSVKIDKVLPDFESLRINNSRGGYRLGISKESSFSIDGKALRGDIIVDGMPDINREIVNTDKTIWGKYGTRSPASEVNIITREGNVKMEIF